MCIRDSPYDTKSSSSSDIIKQLLENEDVFIKYKNEKLAAGKTVPSIVDAIKSARRQRSKSATSPLENTQKQLPSLNPLLRTTPLSKDEVSNNESYLKRRFNSSLPSTSTSQRRNQVPLQDIQEFLEEKYPNNTKTSVLIDGIKQLMETEDVFIRYKKEKMALNKTKDSIIKSIIDGRRLRLSRIARNVSRASNPVIKETIPSSKIRRDGSTNVKDEDIREQQDQVHVLGPENETVEEKKEPSTQNFSGWFDSDSDSL